MNFRDAKRALTTNRSAVRSRQHRGAPDFLAHKKTELLDLGVSYPDQPWPATVGLNKPGLYSIVRSQRQVVEASQPNPDDAVIVDYIFDNVTYVELGAELRARALDFDLTFEGDFFIWVKAPIQRHQEVFDAFHGRFNWPRPR